MDDEVNFAGWTPEKTVQVVEGEAITRVLVRGQPYMSWQPGDEGCLRLAIVQLYDCGLGTEEELAEAFGRHVNSVQRYIRDFACEGMGGLMNERRGPKGRWKMTPELRGKILLIALREGIWPLEAIQRRLAEGWQEVVSVPSIQQVLGENGLGEGKIGGVDRSVVQGELFEIEPERQLLLSLESDGGEAAAVAAGSSGPEKENGMGNGQAMGGDAAGGDIGGGSRRRSLS